MTRSYDVRVAALAIGVDPKWIDNLLTRFEMPGVQRSRQGVERRISDDGLLVIELARVLSSEAGLPLAWSARLAVQALSRRSSDDARVQVAPGAELRIDLALIDGRLRRRLSDAIEAAPRIQRGRPPLKGRTPDG